ncbi:hypothetical protein X975_25805, partial [Stegodyphus mimosarum]
MNDADILIGATCITFCSTEYQWCRAEIKSIPAVDLVNVLFVDYGCSETVPRSVVRYVKYDSNIFTGFSNILQNDFLYYI